MLGRELFGRWADCEKALPLVKGEETPADERDAWEWLRNPLPPASEDPLFATLRLQLGLPDRRFFTDRGFGSLGFLEQQAVGADARARILPASTTRSSATPSCAGGRRSRRRACSKSRRRCPSRSGRCRRAYPGVGFERPGPADQSPVRPRLPGRRRLHRRLQQAHEGGRLHEDPPAATHLLQLRLGTLHGREDAAPRDASKTRRSSRHSLRTP